MKMRANYLYVSQTLNFRAPVGNGDRVFARCVSWNLSANDAPASVHARSTATVLSEAVLMVPAPHPSLVCPKCWGLLTPCR
jgi:hypothetical protein